MKRIIALLLTVILVALSLASCDLVNSSASITADAAKERFAAAIETLADESTYLSEVKIDFASENEEMNAAIESIVGKGITVWHDGENFKAEYAATVGEYDVEVTYVLVGDKLYREILLYVGEERATYGQEYADFSDADKATVLRDAGAGVGVSLDDFSDITAKVSGDKLTVSASNMDKSAASSLANILKGRFSGSGASVIISDDIGYTAVIESGKISSTSISCKYTVILDGETYVLDATITESYTYTETSVTAPAGADKFTKVELDKLI